jgi:hypothetical protein
VDAPAVVSELVAVVTLALTARRVVRLVEVVLDVVVVVAVGDEVVRRRGLDGTLLAVRRLDRRVGLALEDHRRDGVADAVGVHLVPGRGGPARRALHGRFGRRAVVAISPDGVEVAVSDMSTIG